MRIQTKAQLLNKLDAVTASITELNTLTGLTTSAAELNVLDGQTITTGAGAGFTGGTGTIYKTSVTKIGEIKKLSILIDLTGLASSTTDLDIIGTGTAAAYLGRVTAADLGTIFSGRMICLETPAGGITDIDLYSATEATGKFDDGVAAALAETALITSGGAWSVGTIKTFGNTVIPAANEYLYLCGGAAGTAATYTAGKFLIEIEGY